MIASAFDFFIKLLFLPLFCHCGHTVIVTLLSCVLLLREKLVLGGENGIDVDLLELKFQYC